MPTFKIGGRNRPFLFGPGGLARLGKLTDTEPQQYIDEAADAIKAGTFPVVAVANIIFAGLEGGCVALNEPINFDTRLVTVWLDKLDRRELGRIFHYIGECMIGVADVLGDWREQIALDLQSREQ